jgi:hypothetical protein
MGLRGGFGDDEQTGDLLVREPLGDQAQDLYLRSRYRQLPAAQVAVAAKLASLQCCRVDLLAWHPQVRWYVLLTSETVRLVSGSGQHKDVLLFRSTPRAASALACHPGHRFIPPPKAGCGSNLRFPAPTGCRSLRARSPGQATCTAASGVLKSVNQCRVPGTRWRHGPATAERRSSTAFILNSVGPAPTGNHLKEAGAACSQNSWRLIAGGANHASG